MNIGDVVTFKDGRASDRTFVVQNVNDKTYMPNDTVASTVDVTFQAFGHTCIIRRCRKELMELCNE